MTISDERVREIAANQYPDPTEAEVRALARQVIALREENATLREIAEEAMTGWDEWSMSYHVASREDVRARLDTLEPA